MSDQRNTAKAALASFSAFQVECQAAQYTDTGEAWEQLYRLSGALQEIVEMPETRPHAFETASGHKIIAQMETAGGVDTRAGRIILAYRNEKPDSNYSYVTAWLGDGNKEWSDGRYFETRKEALSDFALRCREG